MTSLSGFVTEDCGKVETQITGPNNSLINEF